LHTDSVVHGDGSTDIHPFAAVDPTVELHQITANTPMIEGSGNFFGSTSDPAGVTWNRIQNNGTSDVPWTTPGGDFGVILASQVVSSDGTFYTFASSPAFVAAAQDALDNRGGLLQLILLAPASEGFGGAFVRWDSDDASTAASRPLLTITAFVPEPSSCVLFLGAALLLARRKARA
jgi:hypothetical protein